MNANPGDLVVCVDAKPRTMGPTGLVEGQTYTVAAIRRDLDGYYIVEVPHFIAFHADRFRKAADLVGEGLR